MPQTGVTNVSSPGYPGMLADASMAVKDTGISAEASAEIPFGVMVKKGTANDQVAIVTATTNKFRGIVVADQYAPGVEIGDVGVKPKISMALLQKGRIYVYSEEAVNPSLAVRVRCVATGGEIAGSFRTSADTTDCVDISKFAQWKSTTSAAGPAILEIDMANVAEGVADT